MRMASAFSKKLNDRTAAVVLHFASYDFCRLHGTLMSDVAAEAWIADHMWNMGELLA